MDAVAKLDELRNSVKRAGVDHASATWKEAETALTQALCAKRQTAHATAKQARRDDLANITAGLSTHGEHVKVRKWKGFTKQSSPQASPLLKSGSETAQKVLARATSDNLLTAEDLDCNFTWGNSHDEGHMSSGSCSAREEISARVLAKHQAVTKKARQLQDIREAAIGHISENGRRKVRKKIAEVLFEVRRRQELHAQQEKAKKFREKKFSRGVGPQASLGDLPSEGLGIDVHEDSRYSSIDSPRRSALLRRTALLDSLTLEDIEMLRRNPEWFFSGSAIASTAATAGTHSSTSGGASSSSVLPSQIESPGTTTLQGNQSQSVDECIYPDLTNFFSPTREEMKLDVAQYVRKLRAKSATMDDPPKVVYTNGEGEFQKSLEDAENAIEKEVVEDEPKPPLELMPCNGRHPQTRLHAKSPTLLKMKEVVAKKQEQDVRWLEERRQKIEGKSALNASKNSEQQREHQLEQLKQKELHKEKIALAEERKSLMEAEKQRKAELQNLKTINQVMAATDKVDEAREQRRTQVQATLGKWHEGVARASDQKKRAEIEKRREGQRSYKKYMERLNAIGTSREMIIATQAQRNEELKADIHSSLTLELAAQQQEARNARAEASKKKQEDAALRRQKSKWGYRYCFSERAFGANAGDYDAKHHMVAVDRRGDSWRRSAKEWASIKNSFSMPEIPTMRPLSPGGDLESWVQGELDADLPSPVSVRLDRSETTFFLT